MKDKITFVIFTYNEENRIERVIRNFKNYGSILLADDGSTDRTHEIARSYGCEIYIREGKYDFVENETLLNYIYAQVKTDWIFWCYADELLEKKALEKIKEVINSNKYDVINIGRKNYFYGDFCNNLYFSKTNRIFKKHCITFANNVIHGFGEITVNKSRVFKMPNDLFIHQFIDYTSSSHLNAVNRYTETEKLFYDKPKISLFYFLYELLKKILKNYFFDKGYKSGFSGLALVELTLYYDIVKNLKIYENVHNLTKQSIEDKNNMHRDCILEDFT